MAFLSTFGIPFGTYYGMGSGMMRGFGMGSGWYLPFSLIALVFGMVVLIGALMLNVRPTENITWGIIVLVFSIASFIGMGGYVIGAILGIAGGAIAISYRTQPQKTGS